MRADDFGKCIAQVKSVVDLGFIGNGKSHDERWENNVLHAFKLRSLNDETGSAGAVHKSLRGEAHTQAAMGLANDIGVAKKSGMKLIDCAATEGLGIANAQKLRSAEGKRVEAGDAGSALLAGIGIVEAVVVKEIISGELA